MRPPVSHPRLELMDWKRRVLAMYAAARDGGGGAAGCAAFRAARDALFRDHPQSPLTPEARQGFTGLPYFPHDPAMRVEASLDPEGEGRALVIPTSTGEPTRFTRIGTARAALAVGELSLGVFWLEGYGGGLFVPFRDALAGTSTYGGGRYLLDTVKGADLGMSDDGARLVLDFNLAYNPSCAYDPRWSCPLAPPENRVGFAIPAGERMPAGT